MGDLGFPRPPHKRVRITDALNHAFTSLDRDRSLHKKHQYQGNHRRCNDDVSQPIEMQERTVCILRDECCGEHGAEAAGELLQ